MTDHITKEKRSWNMSRIKWKNTAPEKIIRSLLHSNGYRYSLHRKNLPGSPDLVLPKYKTVIFVHGCFWHQHSGCRRATIPKSNQDYWIPKLKRNIERFSENKKQLKELNWNIIIVWECQLKKKYLEETLHIITSELAKNLEALY
jgi:DNA mismatch endonuclease (patch repair protein)